MFEEGIVDDSGTHGVGPWCAHVLFCSDAQWSGRFWFTLGSEHDPLVLFLGIPTMFKHWRRLPSGPSGMFRVVIGTDGHAPGVGQSHHECANPHPRSGGS